MGSEISSLLKDILSRKDPHGYYVIPASEEALPILREHARRPGVILVEYSDMILFKTRSRSLAEKMARLLARRGLLKAEED
jgi:hypothetical protein